jgi:hypothetical protein
VTLWANRDGNQVTVHATSGAVAVAITEHPSHLRHFWGELGRHLEAVEETEAARAAIERALSVAQAEDPDGQG